MRLLGPLRERDFALLWSGLLVSLLGDGIFAVAVAWAVYDLSNDPVALGVFGVFWSAGQVAFLLTGGVLADRHDKRRLIIAADILRLGGLAAAAALALAETLELWHLWALALVYGTGEGLVGPALSSIVPELVPEPVLLQANALAQVLRPLAFRLAGPAIGGLAVGALGTGGAFVLDAGTFAVSLACLLAMRARPPLPGTVEGPLREQLRDAAAFVRRERWLWATLLAATISLLAFAGPIEVLLPFRIKNELDAGAAAFGAVLAANGAGALLGALAVGQLGLPRHEITVLYLAWGVGTLAIAGYGLAGAVWQLLVLSFAFGLLLGVGQPIWATLMQVRVPAAMRGRVAALDWLVSVGLTPLSFALVGPIAAGAGAQATLVGAGLFAAAVTVGLLYAVPGLRAEDGGIDRAQRATSASRSASNVG